MQTSLNNENKNKIDKNFSYKIEHDCHILHVKRVASIRQRTVVFSIKHKILEK